MDLLDCGCSELASTAQTHWRGSSACLALASHARVGAYSGFGLN